jgi:ring-1,2-phenylacetyl-CoA epoxidase subunit PaaD
VVNEVARAWELLEQVPDPEIPVVSLRELGILREINESEAGIEVVITPTYSACPAMEQIEHDVRAALASHGIRARIVSRLAPAWTTDWMTGSAKEKLREYGIAPPHASVAAEQVVHMRKRGAVATSEVACPHCGSADTTETSHFGSTACKALYKCLACLEPFDYFKPY